MRRALTFLCAAFLSLGLTDQAVGRLGRGIPKRGGASLLQPSDFTNLGAFAVPNTHSLDFGAGLTGRYVAGTLKLYMTNYAGTDAGHLVEFQPVADGSLSMTGPFTAAGSVVDYGDIYQSEIARDVDNGGGGTQPPPILTGLANATPLSFFWDSTASRMYWGTMTSYNNTTTTSDTCLGFSTLSGSTGTGVGMWKLSPPTTYGNRFGCGLLELPSAWAATNVGGRRFGVGFGGNLSIITNGPPSIGPALFAVGALNSADTDHTYVSSTSIIPLINYPGVTNGVGQVAARAPRDSSLHANQYYPDTFSGNSAVWNWGDAFGGMAAAWINGSAKQGVAFIALISGGTLSTTISASPTPTHTVFTVANAGDAQANDVIRWETVGTQGQADYPFYYGTISGVSGNQITVTGAHNGNPLISDDPLDLPLVGGYAQEGSWYQGGGSANSRFYTPLYLYDPANLATAAAGGNPALTPYSMLSYTLTGQAYPIIGGNQNQSPRPCSPKGSWLDTSVTPFRWYILTIGCTNGGAIIHEIAVNAS